MTKRRSAAAWADRGFNGDDAAADPNQRTLQGEAIPMQQLNRDSMSSTFSTDTPLMTTVADLDHTLDMNRLNNEEHSLPQSLGAGRTSPFNPLDNTFKQKYAANV
ncbi:hypothetical protein GGI06_006136, partial [Coemansia sp. S85]